MIREISLQGVGLSWAHTEEQEGIPAENSISKGAELRISRACKKIRLSVAIVLKNY